MKAIEDPIRGFGKLGEADLFLSHGEQKGQHPGEHEVGKSNAAIFPKI